MPEEYIDPKKFGIDSQEKERKQIESLKDANTFAIDVPFESVQKMKSGVETQLGIQLKDRGEAHVTLISPTHGKILREGMITSEDMQKFTKLAGSQIEFSGIGTIPPNLDAEGIKKYLEEEEEQVKIDPKFKPKGVSFFAVIRLPEAIQSKLDHLVDELNATQTDPKKHVKHIEPHVTIGFTLKDRFDSSKTVVNENLPIDNQVTRFEKLVAQKPKKNPDGSIQKGPDGNPLNEYVEV